MDDPDALLASISALVQRKESLLREIGAIELELTTQHRKYARTLNDETPIYRLPNELLTDILLSCKRAADSSPPARKRSPLPFQVTASHVSHRWRAAVLATPLLWNTIDLHIRIETHTEGRMQAQLAAHLLRSGACFIDVTLDFMFMSAAEPYFDMLKKHAGRWRRLSVATNHENVSAFSRLFADVRAPMLEHLSLCVGRPQNDSDRPFSPRRPYITVLPTILASNSRLSCSSSCIGGTGPPAPLLSFVRLAGFALGTLHPPLSAVTTLHLDGWTRHYITPDQLRSVLASAGQLANLSLNQLVMHLPRDPTAHTPPPLVLPALRQLRIRGPCSPAARFLGMVDAPGLEALALQGVDTFHCAEMPSVRALALDACALDEVDILNLFRTLPGVESFSVDESLPDVWEMLTPEEVDDGDEEEDEEGRVREPRKGPAPRPWPRLTTLVLRELQAMDIRHLCYLVTCIHDQARAPGSPYRSQESDPMDLDANASSSNVAESSSDALRSSTSSAQRADEPHGLTKVCLDRRSRTVLRAKHRLTWLEERVVVENRDVPEAWPAGLGYVDAHDLLE